MEELLFIEDEKSSSTIPDIPCAVNEMNSIGLDEMLELWFTGKEWLLERGIHLYDLEPPPGWGEIRFWHTPLRSTPAALPYAHCIWHEGISSMTFRFSNRIACAQDTAGRDIILKVVENDSPQHHIFQTLLQYRSLFIDPRTFPGVLPPISIIDTPHKYCIVTMPMWGTYPDLPAIENVRQMLTFFRCLLEGLSFLHAHRIAHRDICDSNMVVSCYRPDRDRGLFRDDLRELRRGPDLRYAFMDYDQSIQLPLDVSVKDCRRPSDEAWQMGCDLYKPLDVSLGESQYNPFAFDVGMLGNMFITYFLEAVPTVPALAALFDGMTTHVVSRRFSADEALEFLKTHIESLPQEVQDTPVMLKPDCDTMYQPDLYWSRLPASVQAQWSRFRAPPLPRWWHFLNWFMGFPGCAKFVECVRRIFGI